MMGLGSGLRVGGGGPGPGGRPAARCSAPGCQHQRFAVDPDRDLGGVGVDHHLGGGQAGQPTRATPTQQPGRLGGAVDGDRQDPQGAPVQPGPAAQPGQVTHPIGVVGDQHRLGALDRQVPGPGDQPGPGVAGQQPGQLVQGGAGLVVAVGRALHHRGRGPKGGVVDERAAGDAAQIDPQLHPITKRLQAPGGVFAVQPQVEGEMVAVPAEMTSGGTSWAAATPATRAWSRPRRPPPTGRPLGHRLAGQGGHIHRARPLQQGHGGPKASALALRPSGGPSHPPTAGS
jgi:hypothetical protein